MRKLLPWLILAIAASLALGARIGLYVGQRLAAWDKWVAECERLDGLVARDRRQREAGMVADFEAWHG